MGHNLYNEAGDHPSGDEREPPASFTQFSPIQSWDLHTYEVVIKLIAATKTTKGLIVQSILDANTYPLGRKISDEDMATIRIQRNAFHGEWNYTILPLPLFETVIS